jgi:hypothetical protein
MMHLTMTVITPLLQQRPNSTKQQTQTKTRCGQQKYWSERIRVESDFRKMKDTTERCDREGSTPAPHCGSPGFGPWTSMLSESLCGFPQSLQENSSDPATTAFFHIISSSLIILPFEAILCSY